MTKQALPQPAAEWAFFLDLDGTLLEHAERPDAVRVGGAVRKLLAGLQEGAGGALALISGRSVADIDQLCAPLVLPAAGQHGVERRDAAGRMHRHAFPEEPMRRAAARIAAYAARHPGLVFEDKGFNLALHFRLAPWHADAVRELLEAAAAELGEDFEIQAGKMVYELKPGGRDKGTAIGDFMAERPFRDRTPVFIGDDLTDEFGFSVVNRLGGQSIKVGDGASVARWRITDSAAVRRWLAAWVGRFGRRTA